MSTIVTRAAKGTPLTHAEVDANFTNLNADKLESSTAATTYAPKASPVFTGTAGVPLGSTAAPVIYFTGDTNTGLYSPGADQVAFSTGGTQRLLIDAAGQIEAGGIGSAAAPAWSFVSDTNTGIYSPGADQLAISTGGSERARIDSSGRLLVGTSTALGVGSTTPASLLIETTTSTLPAAFTRNDVSATGPVLSFGKSRGTTAGSLTAVANADILGELRFAGADGTTRNSIGAQIQARVDDTPATGDMPGRLVFLTTPSGSAAPVERMRIGSTGVVAIGSTITAGGGSGCSIRFANPLTGSVNPVSVLGTPEVQADATGSPQVFNSAPSIAASAVLGDLRHYNATGVTLGVGSSLVNQYAFYAGASHTTATNNYGFFSAISSGTGRWNFYANGTADSYFASNNFIFANGGTERARVDSSGRLLVGTSASVLATIGTEAALTQIVGATPQLMILARSADAVPAHYIIGKARGTSNEIVLNNDNLGLISFQGADGTNLVRAAEIRAQVDGTPGTNDMPGRLMFATTADGASSPTERMRISNAGTTTLTSAASTAPFIANIGASEVARIDSSGRLLVGTSSTRAVGGNFGAITNQILFETVDVASFTAVGNKIDNSGPQLILGKSRSGTIGGVTAVQNNDNLGIIRFAGANGTDLSNLAAEIRVEVDGEPFTAGDLTDLPGRLMFYTTADGASTPTEQWRISNGGTVIYNQPAPAAVDVTATLTVANLTAKIITSTTAAAVTMTLPTGTLMDGGFSGLYNNMAFEWTVINTGGTNAVTVQAGASHTLVGSGTVAANGSGRFLSRRTAATTWETYRLAT